MTPSRVMIEWKCGSRHFALAAQDGADMWELRSAARRLALAQEDWQALAEIIASHLVLKKRRSAKSNSDPALARHSAAWDETEDRQLIQLFEAAVDFKEMAKAHQRTRGAITARLEKLGRLAPQKRGA